MCDGGRDLEGMELVVEYCDRRFLEACDIGRGRVLLRAGGEVMSGGSAGCAELAAGGEMEGGEVAGDGLGDMMAVMAHQQRAGESEERIARVCGVCASLALDRSSVGPPSTRRRGHRCNGRSRGLKLAPRGPHDPGVRLFGASLFVAVVLGVAVR